MRAFSLLWVKLRSRFVHGFEFAAVDGDDRLREEIEIATKHYELAADAADGLAVVFAKVGNGFEVWRRSSTKTSTTRTGFSSAT